MDSSMDEVDAEEVESESSDSNVSNRSRRNSEVWDDFTNIDPDVVLPTTPTTTFSQQACEEAVLRMIIIDGLPFNFVESQGFIDFCNVTCPEFVIPCPKTLARNCIRMFKEEKKKLKCEFKGQRICVSIDIWTSLQDIKYLCVTAHYVDSEWNLKKKILSLCVVPNHKGATIGRMVEKCLLEWEIDGVFTVTCDNANSNDLGIEFLKKRMKHWEKVVLEHEFLHVRCSAQILSLIVRDGLKTFDESIVKVRNAVRYVRSSLSRWASWKECVKMEKIDCDINVCLDVPTEWNTTYKMLEAAEKFEGAFEKLKDEDGGYMQYFDESIEHGDGDEIEGCTSNPSKKSYSGPPEKSDWDRVRMFVQFLQDYLESTNNIFGSNYVSSDILFHELITVRSSLKQLCDSEEIHLCEMGLRMVEKFDMHWSLENKINPLLLVAVVLDPRFKLEYVRFSLMDLYEASKIDSIVSKVKITLQRLHEWYAGNSSSMASQNESEQIVSDDEVNDFATEWRRYIQKQRRLRSVSEVEKYLTYPLEEESGHKAFEILGWWKNNTTDYPFLSLLARDVLAIPVTSVASESAFSTTGRILDPFHSSLRPNTVEALICMQNWLRSNAKPIDLQASMKEIEQYDAMDAELFEAATSSLLLQT